MTVTDYTLDNKEISYEINDDGYLIYLGGEPWIHQYEPFIPYPDLGYEGSCLKQIEEITTVPEQPLKDPLSTEAQLLALQEKNASLEEQLEIQAQAITELAEILGGAE